MSLAATSRKLGISFFDEILYRILGNGHIPPLADIIKQQAEKLNLGVGITPKPN